MSSSFFSKVASDPSSLSSEFSGPDYKYSKFINSPAKMGMSTSGSSLDANVAGIINYIQLLIEGTGPASATGKPLGDKYFIITGGQCKSSDGSKVQRSIYIDNVPGDGPSFLGDLGMNMTSFSGLLPGIVDDLSAFNPVGLFSAFMDGATPDCSQVTLKTINENDDPGVGTGFIVNSEISDINPCNFTSGTNTITGEKCTESFISANAAIRRDKKPPIQSYVLKNNKFASMYTTSVGFLLVYLIYCLIKPNQGR